MKFTSYAVDEFWNNVKITEGGCWEWQGSRDKDGYGINVRFDERDGLRAHRLAFELCAGDIPRAMFVCHSCDNPPCINPDHLFLGTPKINQLDAKNKKRMASGEKNGAYTKPDQRRRGETHGRSKLTVQDVQEIRDLAERGMRHEEIAQKFGVVQTCITKIVHRIAWRHVQ